MKLWNIAVNFGPAGSSWEQRAADRVEVRSRGELVGLQIKRTADGEVLESIWAYAPGVWVAYHSLEPVKEERLVS